MTDIVTSFVRMTATVYNARRALGEEYYCPMTYIIIGIGVFYLLSSIRILKQYERGVVFLLGKFTGIRNPGLTFIFAPFQMMTRVSFRTVTMQIPSQKIITKDNVSIDIAAVAYYKIVDPEKSVIQIENVYS